MWGGIVIILISLIVLGMNGKELEVISQLKEGKTIAQIALSVYNAKSGNPYTVATQDILRIMRKVLS